MPVTHPVRVKIREVTFSVLTKNILGQQTLAFQTAYGPGRPEIDPSTLPGVDVDPNSEEYQKSQDDFRLGQRIELLDDDYVRLVNGDAVADAEQVEQDAANTEEVVLAEDASEEDLVDWIRTEKPTVQEVVDASEGDPNLAKKLLAAESKATQENPRRGVLEGLSTVVARG